MRYAKCMQSSVCNQVYAIRKVLGFCYNITLLPHHVRAHATDGSTDGNSDSSGNSISNSSNDTRRMFSTILVCSIFLQESIL